MRIDRWMGRAAACVVVLGCSVVLTLASSMAAQVAAHDDVDTRANYAKSLTSASDLITKGDLNAAQKTLDSADLTQRGFEWRHLKLAIELARATTAGLSARVTSRTHLEIAAPKTTPVTVLHGHVAACRAIAFSPLGDRIATCALDHTIRLWNARTGDSVRVLSGHEGAVVAVAFSPDGSKLLSASDDGSARLWDATSGDTLLVLRIGASAVTAVAWSHDGSQLATAAEDRAIRIWPTNASEARIALRGHEEKITALAFTKDDSSLVSGSDDRTVRVWNLASGDCARINRRATQAVTAIAISPSGAQLASASLDENVRVWSAALGTMQFTVAGQGGGALALAFSPDGRRLATTAGDGSVNLVDATDGSLLLMLHGHEGPVRGVAFSPKGDRLATCGDDQTVRIYETDASVARAAQREAVAPLPSVDDAEHSKPLEVDALCARIVQRPGLPSQMYEDAETLARATLGRLPESGQVHTTLGGAQYRLEKYTEALDTLTLAGDQRKGWPPNLAFRAMTLARLDRIDEAKTMVTRLATLLKEERWSQDVEAAALFDEARNVVDAKTPPKK